jgi:hypothetical protein
MMEARASSDSKEFPGTFPPIRVIPSKTLTRSALPRMPIISTFPTPVFQNSVNHRFDLTRGATLVKDKVLTKI